MRRLDQTLANLGYCSRREARDWLRAGRVRVGGEPEDDPGRKAAALEVTVDGEPLDHPEGLLLLFHKPAGLVCSHEGREGPSVYDGLPERWRRRNPPVTSVGRLDKETTGLLLLTDLPDVVHRLTSPRHKVPKVYRAVLDRAVPAEAAERFAAGALLLPGEEHPCAPAALEVLGPREARLTLTEGRYHQVRRMFGALGATVVALHRESFGSLTLEGVAPGQWRELPPGTFAVASA